MGAVYREEGGEKMLKYIEKELFRGQDAIEAYMEGHGSEEGLLKDLKGIAKRISPVWREYNEKVIVPQGRKPIVFNDDVLCGEDDVNAVEAYMFIDEQWKKIVKVDLTTEKDVRSFCKRQVEDDLYGLARYLTQARIAEMKEQPMKREASIVNAIGKLSFTIYDVKFSLERMEEVER